MSSTTSESCPASPDRAHVRWIFITAFLAVALGCGWTLNDYFQGDDFGFIGRYHDYPWSAWPKLFVHAWADGLWSIDLRELRPLNALAFMIDGHLWGGQPAGYRVTNLLLHAGAAALVGLAARRVALGDLATGIVATLLFAFHPVQVSAVAWITGRVDLLSTFFYLGAFLAFLRFRQETTARAGTLVLLALGFAGALFTKESGLTLPALVLAADALWLGSLRRWRQPRTWTPYLVSAAVLGVYLGCRYAAFGNAGPSGIGNGLSPLHTAGFPVHLARREGAYLAHLVFFPLLPWLREWQMEGFAPTATHLTRAALVVAVIGALAFALRRAARRAPTFPAPPTVLFFGAAWFFITTLPLVITYFSARHLYLSTAGLAVALALGLRRVTTKRASHAALAALLVGFFAWQFLLALQPWHRAAEISRAIAGELRATTDDDPPGALLLDVPDLHANAFCWSWAVPYALRPPFQSRPLDAESPVLESPSAYAFDRRWLDQRAVFAALRRLDRPAWLVRVDDAGQVRRDVVDAERVRAASARFEAVYSAPSWSRFVADLTAPPALVPPSDKSTQSPPASIAARRP